MIFENIYNSYNNIFKSVGKCNILISNKDYKFSTDRNIDAIYVFVFHLITLFFNVIESLSV